MAKTRGLPQPPARPGSATEAIDLRCRGRARLAAAVQRAVTVGKTPSPALRALAELNFPLIITTNYDRLFEDALLMAGKNPTTAVYQPKATARPEDPLQDPSPQNPFIFKIQRPRSDRLSPILNVSQRQFVTYPGGEAVGGWYRVQCRPDCAH